MQGQKKVGKLVTRENYKFKKIENRFHLQGKTIIRNLNVLWTINGINQMKMIIFLFLEKKNLLDNLVQEESISEVAPEKEWLVWRLPHQFQIWCGDNMFSPHQLKATWKLSEGDKTGC